MGCSKIFPLFYLLQDDYIDWNPDEVIINVRKVISYAGWKMMHNYHSKWAKIVVLIIYTKRSLETTWETCKFIEKVLVLPGECKETLLQEAWNILGDGYWVPPYSKSWWFPAHRLGCNFFHYCNLGKREVESEVLYTVMWVRQVHKQSPSHHHFDRWYVYHSQLCFIHIGDLVYTCK